MDSPPWRQSRRPTARCTARSGNPSPHTRIPRTRASSTRPPRIEDSLKAGLQHRTSPPRITRHFFMPVRIHPTAIIERDVVLGEGTSVWDNAHIRHGAQLGEQCIVGGKATIAYDVRIGN